MTRDEAFELLPSEDATVRLKAARFFAMNATSGDRRRLKAALLQENVPWIKRALERAISRLGPAKEAPSVTQPIYADPPQRLVSELRAKVIDEVAGTIIHELSTIVASLRLVAPRESPGYTGSRTETLVNSLSSLLGGIRNLKAAASRANYSQRDLAQECRDACGIFVDDGELFQFGGPTPFLVEIDPDLFKIALTNVVKNAVEAVRSLPEGVPQTVTLNWGHAGHEYWVSVLDTGFGFERDPAGMVDFGQSTKDKAEHLGFGLATAKQAMQALEGDIYPTNALEGGAKVELRWFSGDEDPIR